MEYLYIGIGGFFGAMTRYGLSKWVGRHWSGKFPVATFWINITGSFILGLLFVAFAKAGPGAADLKSLAAAGFLGAYTTFSTFAFEIVSLIEEGDRDIAVKYFLTSISLGLAAALLGLTLARYFWQT
ncbi:fluoride efflux transporter CrcB [Phosphitispora fastidiosa]|uniref:fluoride efflux transporter CrcB n=1 Tax=Phosphitispora fastidiosa TaxID=2837202 RepID=UPI001E6223D6|nr:fluoride efflux transporter CrcB [Phosphitispora fastidiosa]MBU7007800.1 CrcB protein [Phosphitispora fastidiosa]